MDNVRMGIRREWVVCHDQGDEHRKIVMTDSKSQFIGVQYIFCLVGKS